MRRPPDAASEKTYAAEAAVASIRAAVIALNSATYLFFLDKTGSFPLLAYGVIVAANIYGVSVLVWRPYRRFSILLSSYFTTALDAVFITLWLGVTGGFESPFYLLWMLSITAVAFRYDGRAIAFSALVYAVSYLALLAFMGELVPHAAEVGLRLGYIGLTAALGAALSREVFTQTREKHEMRALADALRESEERFRRLSDATAEGIAVHGEGKIVEVNSAFARMFGYEPAQLVGMRVEELIDPVSLPAVAQHLARPSDEPYAILARRQDGATFRAEIAARTIPWSGRGVRVVSVHDLTERERAERAMREREVLALQNERLREMDTIKTRFINNAAHELGTPLTPIKLQAHLLKLGGLGELNDKQRRAVDVLTRNVDHLGLMVKDLLDASRVQTHELTVERRPVAIGRVLEEAVDSFRPSGKNAVTLALDVEPDLVVAADPKRMTQVAFNLLGNALRFTPPGGRVDVRARRAEDHVLIEVTDSGAGIDPHDIPRLFQPFSQVHDTMQSTAGGTGLGLFITKGIVEAHGGRIWCTSDGKGKGTTFHVALPLR